MSRAAIFVKDLDELIFFSFFLCRIVTDIPGTTDNTFGKSFHTDYDAYYGFVFVSLN